MANSLLYRELPQYFVWNKSKKQWKLREKSSENVLGRIYSVNPRDGERYYLRCLLNHVRGAKSFEDIRTVDNIVYCTFREAAIAKGLLENDEEWSACLTEASLIGSPHNIRAIFATILIFCDPLNPRKLWDNYKNFMVEDYLHNNHSISIADAENQCLLEINYLLFQHQKSLADYNEMPLPDIHNQNYINGILFSEETNFNVEDLKKEISENIPKMNSDQKNAFDMVNKSIYEPTEGCPQIFFIDGPGGTGKTFLYNAILAFTRSKKHIALAVASSGIGKFKEVFIFEIEIFIIYLMLSCFTFGKW